MLLLSVPIVVLLPLTLDPTDLLETVFPLVELLLLEGTLLVVLLLPVELELELLLVEVGERLLPTLEDVRSAELLLLTDCLLLEEEEDGAV